MPIYRTFIKLKNFAPMLMRNINTLLQMPVFPIFNTYLQIVELSQKAKLPFNGYFPKLHYGSTYIVFHRHQLTQCFSTGLPWNFFKVFCQVSKYVRKHSKTYFLSFGLIWMCCQSFISKLVYRELKQVENHCINESQHFQKVEKLCLHQFFRNF